ncbi:hypothetical protein IFM89_015396 [Coptis chinensis]|uniref:Uncharacterized protein n=1 Tax=Coptis chinensis TaxID=261450 RepID=A0A835IYZ8_9MAGN|nr:hypothetical protein IFM89_015396 [Coptis chinensis]
MVMRNFLGSGSSGVRKGVTVKWDLCCKPQDEGGLGLRRLKDAKFKMRTGESIQYHKNSTVGTGVRGAMTKLIPHPTWVIGDGSNVHCGGRTGVDKL